MQFDYQRLVRDDPSRGLLRELGLGIALVISIALACLLLPALPEQGEIAVGTGPPANPTPAVSRGDCSSASGRCLETELPSTTR